MGIAGLLVAAILAAAMSNLSAALNSLSSTTVVDFYMRWRPERRRRERMLIVAGVDGDVGAGAVCGCGVCGALRGARGMWWRLGCRLRAWRMDVCWGCFCWGR